MDRCLRLLLDTGRGRRAEPLGDTGVFKFDCNGTVLVGRDRRLDTVDVRVP